MKNFYYFLLASFLLISVSVTAQQRNCYSAEYLEEKLQENPAYRGKLAQLEALIEQRANNTDLQRNTGHVLYVPVVVHVVWNSENPAENISDAQVESQIDVIYRDFRGLNEEWQNIKDNIWSQAADMEIEFYLAQIDPDGNPTNGITRKETNVASWGTNDNIKFSTSGGVDAWDPTRYFNFWVGNIGGGVLGYATFPASAGDPDDGIVMSPDFFGSSDYEAAAGETFFLSPPYDKGRTTTHEIGHYLNLRHIWGDGGCGVDDFVTDTPESDNPNFGCDVGVVSCGTTDMVENYMDYSDDECMGLFTEEQKNRMRAVLEAGGPRETLEQPPFPFLITVNEDSQDLDVCTTDTAVVNLTYNLVDPTFTDTVTFSASGLPTGSTATFNPTSASADNTPVTLTISNLNGASVDNYTIIIEATDGTDTAPTNMVLNVYDTNFSTLSVISPEDNATDVNTTIVFEWSEDTNAAAYEIEISTDAGFTNIIAGGVPEDTTFEATLSSTTEYFWRVRAVNDCATGDYAAASFTTGNIICNNYDSTDTPVAIPDNTSSGIDSVINIPTTSLITDVNVTLSITHTWVNDLILTLIAPNGTEVILSNRNGAANADDYSNTEFDQEATNLIGDGVAPFTGTFVPDGDLSVFYGGFSGGDWTLNVSDNAGADTGSIVSWTLEICGIPQPDIDADGIPNDEDNCPEIANADQADMDADGIGDVCDDDIDGDGILNDDDNCPESANSGQEDIDDDGIGDVCDVECQGGPSSDTPITIDETVSNVPYTASVNIERSLIVTDVNVTINIDHSWASDLDITLTSPSGLVVELTTDNGGSGDNYTDTTFDQDADTSILAGSPPFTGSFTPEGDLSDFNGSLSDGNWTLTVIDDTIFDGGLINSVSIEVCGVLNPDDLDSDTILNDVDNCPLTANIDQEDIDNDGIGDVCDDDIDGDDVLNAVDNCVTQSNPDQADNDNDGLGDVCDDDDDNDGVNDLNDNCEFTPNPNQSDLDLNGVGDVCDGLIANNVLTPNGDGVNDTWTILNAERFTNATVKVYNRWGNEVFSAKGYNNDWAGTYSGDTLPTGSYYYKIDQNGDGSIILTGWIYLTL